MNQIDEKFQELLLEINRKSKQEVFNKIKENYNKQPPEIKNALENYYKTFSYWGKLEEIRGEYESLYLRATSLKEHIDDYLWLYNHLQDYRSKKLLYAVLNNWYNFDTTTTKTAIERNYDQYCDLDLIQPSSTEVIVDLGAYVGDTILTYINNYGLNQYQKIYAYEITPESIELLKNNTRYYSNIEIRKKAILDVPRTIYMKTNDQGSSANQISDEGEEILEGTSIDEDIKEPISIIKMDIEGAETKAIIGCQNHIKTDSPKLLISVYHNYEDLWKIPRMIDEMNSDYKFYLRCYGTEVFPTEIILYAIK